MFVCSFLRSSVWDGGWWSSLELLSVKEGKGAAARPPETMMASRMGRSRLETTARVCGQPRKKDEKIIILNITFERGKEMGFLVQCSDVVLCAINPGSWFLSSSPPKRRERYTKYV